MKKLLTHAVILFLFLLPEKIFAQVNPAFTITYQVPNCAPALVSFTDATTGVGPFTYQWNFGLTAGVNSTLQNPSATLLAPC